MEFKHVENGVTFVTHRTRVLFVSLIVLVLVGVATALFVTNLFKVTDPADPRFNPDKFKFYDYAEGQEKADVFKKLFPVGTPKKYVDSILVDSANATIWQREEKLNFYGYKEPRHFHWKQPPSHFFLFDDDFKLVNISPGGGPILYKDQPDYIEYYKNR